MNGEQKCDGAFLEEVEARWEFQHAIDAYTFPRLLALAKQGGRVKELEKLFQFYLKGKT